MKSNVYSECKGFSVLGVILTILLLAGLGLGGYLGYTHYLAPMMDPYAKLLPEGLKNVVPGANADGFVVYKKDTELSENLKKLPTEMMMANSVESAVVVFTKEEQRMLAYVEFSSANEAEMAKRYLSDLAQQNNSLEGTYESSDNLLIISNGKGGQEFSGLLKDNPGISRIDEKRISDQLIAYFDLKNLGDLSSVLPSIGGGLLPISLSGLDSSAGGFPPIAHAQEGFLSPSDAEPVVDSVTSGEAEVSSAAIAGFLKDMLLYLRLKDGQLSLDISVNILSKEELASSEEQEKTYDQALESLRTSIPDLNRATGLIKMLAPSIETKILLDNLAFNIKMQSSLQELIDLAVKADLVSSVTDGPSKAHDAAKKAAANNIIAALEQYNAANGNYPERSLCVDEMPELSEYFRAGKSPVDEKGPQKFGDLECPGGYYYQWIPGKGYVVWAKMILEQDGNMELTPDQYLDNLQKNLITTKVSAGQFYAWGDGLILDQSPNYSDMASPQGNAQTSQPKVKIRR